MPEHHATEEDFPAIRNRGLTVWFTGLSGAGKTTLSRATYSELLTRGFRVECLDGDAIRQNLTKDLSFSKDDRDENVRRIGFVAELLTRHGVIVLVSAISPYRSARDQVREQIGDFLEIYVHAPIEVCEARDVKGLYRRARAGEIRNLTGIDDPYEPPMAPDIECRTDQEPVEVSVARILNGILRTLSGKSLATAKDDRSTHAYY